MTSIVSNFKVNMDKLIAELNSDGKFELSRAEQEMVKEQCEFHLIHVTPRIISKEEHKETHDEYSRKR